MKSAPRTHCRNGHLMTGANLYVSPKGVRSCRICLREERKQYYAQHFKGGTGHIVRHGRAS